MEEEPISGSDSGEESLSKKDKTDPRRIVARWIKEKNLVKDSKHQKTYERIGEKIIKQYTNRAGMESYAETTDNSAGKVMFNILWSNVEVLQPSLFSAMPKTAVERRFKDSDPVGRLASELVDRAVTYTKQSQQDRYMWCVKTAVKDRLLPGRGVVWITYDCEFEDMPEDDSGQNEDEEALGAGDPIDSLEEDSINDTEAIPDEEDTEPDQQIKPYSECLRIDYVNWLDYLQSPARHPYEIRWRMRKFYWTRAELIKECGEDIGKAVPLGKSNKKRGTTEEDQQFLQQAEVWLVEDKEEKQRIWFCEAYKDRPLKVEDDVIGFKDFFSSPDPLLATTTGDSMYPTPDFVIYMRLADELDYVTKRLMSIADCVRLVGMAAADVNKDIKNMLKLNDGQLWPYTQWAQFMQDKGGLAGAINWFPFDQAAAVIPLLTQYRDDVMSQINLITGIPDLAQGDTDPDETATAQDRKSDWAIPKLREKRDAVHRFCRQIDTKLAECIFNNDGLFSDDTIALMCGVYQMQPEDQAMYPQALALLRNDELRTFRVDIETDSTIAVDEEDEQAARMNYMQTLSTLVGEIESVSQFRPELMNPILESAMWAVRAFRSGRSVEGAWEKAIDQIEDNDAQQAAAAAAQPPTPDPEVMKQQLAQQEFEDKQQYQLAQQNLEERKQGFTEQQETQKLQFDQQKHAEDNQLKLQIAEMTDSIQSQNVQIQGFKVSSEAQQKQTATNLKAIQDKFSQFADSQMIELDKTKTAILAHGALLDDKRQQMEDKRQQQQDHLDALKTVNEHIGRLSDHMNALTDHVNSVQQHLQSKKEETQEKPPAQAQVNPPKPPDIHVHIGGNKIIKKQPDGSFMSSDAPDTSDEA